jgi:ribosomal protein S18 acetylase RimI-like enzyme
VRRAECSGASIDVLDLRHFTAAMLKPVLDVETQLWEERLHWDYRNSIRLLTQYLDNRALPGFAATNGELVTGYVFCVHEESKTVIGDVFAADSPTSDSYPGGARALEEKLLLHLLELLLNSPQIDRIEAQMLIHPSGTHDAIFRRAGFDVFRRLFLVLSLAGHWNAPRVNLPAGLELRPWRDEDLAPAARLIAEAYRNHPDSMINDQYRTVHGSMRFLNNIVRYAGCGVFSPHVSAVIAHRTTREFAGLLLGSRVSPSSGHITQVCVHPEYRRKGLGHTLLALAAHGFLRQGVAEVSLTVTEANANAIELYMAEGYKCQHTFDAAVWQRSRIA